MLYHKVSKMHAFGHSRQNNFASAFISLLAIVGLTAVTQTIYAAPAATAQTSAKTELNAGTNILQFPNSTGDATRPIRVFCYKPRNCPPNAPIVFVMHGVHRDADRYCREWAPFAEQSSFLLVCPEFDAARFGSHQYPLGNIFDDNKAQLPKNQWTYTTIENLFDWIKVQAGNTSASYYLFGHSAGAQFVHRFVLFMPDARYQRAAAANAGYYLMPTYDDHKFPYGLRDLSISRDSLARSFSRDFVIMLGEQDTDQNDPDLNQRGNAEEQGATRLERGQKFYATAKSEATKLGRTFNWRLEIVPGAHHKHSQIVAPAVTTLLSR